MTFQAPDLPEKFEAFRDALRWASGCEIYWALQSDEGRMREANEVWGVLQIFRIRKLGVDDIRYEDTGDPTNPAEVTQCGNRILQFQLNMRARSNEHRNSAWYAATKAQQRINAPFSREQWLSPNEIALGTVGEVIDTPGGELWDNRMEDVAILEFNMTTTLVDKDAANVTTYIESILATTGFKQEDGSDLDSSLQLNDEVMP